MRVKQGFVLRDMCGEHIVSAEGIGNFDFNKVISLNDTAAYLWNAVSGRDFDEGLLAADGHLGAVSFASSLDTPHELALYQSFFSMPL